jgi:PPP family 3-phenylpropionic acid transporter
MLACALSFTIRERPAPRAAVVPAAGASGASALPADKLQRQALWSFLGLLFVWMFSNGAVVSLWPVYMNDIGYSQTAIGGLWALAAMGEVPCMILAGHLADHWGSKRVLLTAMTSMSIVFLAYTLETNIIWLVGVQLLRSFAYSCFETPALVYATALGLRHQRGRLAGLYYSASGLGGITGSAVGGLVAQQTGLPAMFRGVAALMLASAAVVGKTMPRQQPAPAEGANPASAAQSVGREAQ